jgi:hypothetical protein
MPVGSSRVIALPAGWSGAAIENPSPDALAVKARGAAVTLSGRSASVVPLHFRKGPHEAELKVRILEQAGEIAPTAAAPIAGATPDSDFLLDAMVRAVDQASRPASGAEVAVYVQTRAGLGGTARLTAWLEGPGLWPVSRAVSVALRPTEARFADPSWLAASNEPERIERDGTLLDTPLGQGGNVFYFHHQNAPGAPPRLLTVRLENHATTPVDLLIMESGAGPSRDELYAGHLATWRYMRWMLHGDGLRIHLGSMERCVLDQRILDGREVACGLGQVMVLSGAPPRLVVDAAAIGPSEVASDAGPATDGGPPRPTAVIVRGRGLYARPVRDLQATYSFGGPYAFVPIGGPPYDEPVGAGTPNAGNYGVDHRLHLRLVNPTAEEQHVYVVFAVGGGVARGSLVVDGRLVETPLLKNAVGSGREFPLADYVLGPGQERTVEIRALPEMGSNYPIRIVAKPLPANR